MGKETMAAGVGWNVADTGGTIEDLEVYPALVHFANLTAVVT